MNSRFWLVGCLLCLACETEVPSVGGGGGSSSATPDGGLRLLECGEPATGCPCPDNAAARTCYLEPEITPHGAVCQQGTRLCRGGVWSSCEQLESFVLPTMSALVSDPLTCNPCDPGCYFTNDRPIDTDLTPDNSTGVVYDPDAGGITLDDTISDRRDDPADPAVCGDGMVESVEECDDGNLVSGDGCDIDCLLEDGYACPGAGGSCHVSVCGDGVAEGSEECDDANSLIGDGCTPFCEVEPSCSGGTCTPICGDGQVFPGEACDDGNGVDGDGCSSSCTLEAGYSCTLVTTDPPDEIDLPVVLRDVRSSHPDFQNWCCGMDYGMVANTWGPDRKPVPVIGSGNPSLSTTANFSEWYNDSAQSRTYADHLTVTRQADGTYAFDSNRFFPLDGLGFSLEGEPEPNGHNYHFTSEVRFWFTYERGQQLSFRGDDDVWVFINGHLTVDIGGVHGARADSVTLDATNEASLGLTEGGLYEAAVFQAERHTTGSNYRLTLAGFFFGLTECVSVCGDGILTRDEVCDDGTNDGSPGTCNPGCQSWAPAFPPSGAYSRTFDSAERCNPLTSLPFWEQLAWEASTPSDTRIQFQVRTAAVESDLDSATPTSVDVPIEPDDGSVDLDSLLTGAGLSQSQRFLRLTAVLFPSTDGTLAPTLETFEVRYNCLDSPD